MARGACGARVVKKAWVSWTLYHATSPPHWESTGTLHSKWIVSHYLSFAAVAVMTVHTHTHTQTHTHTHTHALPTDTHAAPNNSMQWHYTIPHLQTAWVPEAGITRTPLMASEEIPFGNLGHLYFDNANFGFVYIAEWWTLSVFLALWSVRFHSSSS